MIQNQKAPQRHRCHRRLRWQRRIIYLITAILLLAIVLVSAQAQAGETSIYLAVDPLHGAGETGAFLEHRRENFQLHAGCFNPCAAGLEYLWRFPDENIRVFLGGALLDGVNHVNGTKLNFSGGIAWQWTRRVSLQWRHYSNGAGFHSPISDDQAPNRGWNFFGASVDF